jgi:hypothetical protein
MLAHHYHIAQGMNQSALSQQLALLCEDSALATE